MKYFHSFLTRKRFIAFLPLAILIGSAMHNAQAADTPVLHSSAKRSFLARAAAHVKNMFASKKRRTANSQQLAVRNDLLDLVDMCDLDDDLLPHFETFKVFVNGVHVPLETEKVGLTDVPHSPGMPCKISIMVPAATLLAILQNKQFTSYKTYVSDQIHDYIITRPFVNWISRQFGSQERFISFLTKYAKAQVIFSYQLDARDLNRNGQLSILTVIASKKYEWQTSLPTIIPRWRPLRTIELVFHDSYIGNL